MTCLETLFTIETESRRIASHDYGVVFKATMPGFGGAASVPVQIDGGMPLGNCLEAPEAVIIPRNAGFSPLLSLSLKGGRGGLDPRSYSTPGWPSRPPGKGEGTYDSLRYLARTTAGGVQDPSSASFFGQ